jgi:signal transduction histidine kinase
MVGDLMDLSRLEAHRLELVREAVDVADLARASVERLPRPAGRPIDVRVVGDVSKCSADPDRVAQVMDNLLTNAVKYGSPDTPILVEVAPAQGGVSVAVTNEGPGIPPQDVQRVFDRFERAERRGSIKGVGLGLYITRGLVEAHGGHIGVRSRSGKTTFEFVLPAG